MRISLTSELLFLLFSFLFGGFVAFLRQTGRQASRILFGGFAVRTLAPAWPWPPHVGGLRLREKKEKGTGKKERKRHFSWGEFFSDLRFFLLFSASYSLFLYVFHDGAFRLYSLLLVFVGFCLYRKTVAVAVGRFLAFCLTRLRLLLTFALGWLSFPIAFLLKKAFLLFGLLFSKIRVPFARVCGILTDRAQRKKRLRALQREEEARKRKKAALRVLYADRGAIVSHPVQTGEKRKNARKELHE